jgi:hypothetical protein
LIFPCDSAIVVPRPLDGNGPVALNREPRYRQIYRQLLADRGRLTAGMEKGTMAAAQGRGVYIDTEVFSLAERDRLPFYAEIVRTPGPASRHASARSPGRSRAGCATRTSPRFREIR